MSVLPPGDLFLSPELISTDEALVAPTRAPSVKLTPAQRERKRELEISKATGRPLGDVRMDIDRRDAKLREKDHEEYRGRLKSSPGFIPTLERGRHGQEVGPETIVVKEPLTRPEYSDLTHQVEQRVVSPAEEQRVVRAISPVESMRRRGTISDAMAYWADVWHRNWALAEAGYRSALAVGVGREPGGLSEAVVIAASELRAVEASVGKIGNRILTELVGQELSLQQMAIIHKMNRQEMTGICKAVLQRLLEHYEP